MPGEGDHERHRSEVGREGAAAAAHHLDDAGTDLGGKLGQPLFAQRLHVFLFIVYRNNDGYVKPFISIQLSHHINWMACCFTYNAVWIFYPLISLVG